MKLEKGFSWICAVALAFLLSFGGTGCLVSGFSLDADMTGLGIWCAVFALGGGLCYLIKRGDAIVACVFALALGYLWRQGTLVSSFSALAYEISFRYNGGYGWGVLGQPGGTVTAALLLVAADIALCAARTVCRRDTGFPAITFALAPLLLCVVLTDTVPGEGFLGCLFMGLILLLLTQSLRRSDPMQANTLTAMAAVPLALALGLLFWAVPKESYVNRYEEMQDTLVNWAQQVPEIWEELTAEENVAAANDDRTQRIDLDNMGPKKQYTYAVMDVYSDTGGVLYLREQDYDSYSGTGWSNTVNRSEKFARGDTVVWISGGTVSLTTKRVRDVLYYPYYPAEDLTLAGGCVVNDGELTTYAVERYMLPSDWRSLLSGESEGNTVIQFPVGESNTRNKQRYTKLPGDTAEWAEEVLAQVLKDPVTATDKADAIAAYVRGSAKYDLNTEKMDDDAEDFARWFLEESDTGYCVHFATAAAVLLRAAGVECRYVTGYMIQAKAGETVTVTADRAHAWVEYYEPLLDIWIVLEATPSVAGSIGTPTEETGTTEETGETGTVPTEETEEATGSTEIPEETGEAQTGGGEGPEEDNGEKMRRGGFGWILAVLLAAAVPIQREVRVALRRQRIRRGTPNRRALILWRETTRMARLLKQHPPKELEELAQKAKFSQHTLTAQELTAFESWLREARRRVREMPWYRRLLWRYLYAL